MKGIMPRASKLYFAYPKEFNRNICEFKVREFDVDRFDDECIKKFKTISIETPRTNFIFSGRKIFLFDRTKPTKGVSISHEMTNYIEKSIRILTQMESYDLINSKKDVLPNLPLKVVLGSPIIVGQYIYLFGQDFGAHPNSTICTR